MTDSESALVKPFRNIYKFLGAFVDAIYYFVDSLFNPNRTGRLTSSGRSSGLRGSRVRTLRPPGSGGNAPNMSFGGCKTCM